MMKPTRGLTPARRPPPGGKPRLLRMASQDSHTEDVAVYCRLRPPSEDNEDAESVRTDGDRVVVLIPPEGSRAFRGGGREFHYTFTRVFDMYSVQKAVFEHVCFPLVRDLLTGKNALLFTYGVTGSGKTHTMQGTPGDGGLMSRAVDVIFNSLQDLQVRQKRVVVPDESNGFVVQTNAQAMDDRQREMIRDRQQRPQRRNNVINTSDPNLSGRLPDESRVDCVDKNAVYAVFISYVEVYNNNIYDLLEADARDIVTGKTKFTRKILRADSYDCQYVHDCNEVQVESAREALETFYRGQKRRRVAHTALNIESSRSHSVFSIRLVKAYPAPYDEVSQDRPMLVSQLALVDMAGSERNNRTGNVGDELEESSKINQSLMTLRRCIEQLRNNQKTGRRNNVPYRDSKITHLFRNYFEGNGAVKMVVCVNPRTADFDENINVMDFAEATQKVQIERVDPLPREIVTPGQSKGNEAYREALRRANGVMDTPNLPYSPIYSLGPEWPSLEMKQCDDEDMLDNLARYLEKRITTRNTLVADYGNQNEQFRKRLVDAEKELILLREENNRLKYGNDGERRRIRDLESRLVNAEAANTSLQKKIGAFSEAKVVLEKELDEKELLLNQHKKDQKRSTKRYISQLSQQEAINSELAVRLQEQEATKEMQRRDHAKLRAVKSILRDENGKLLNKTISDPDVSTLDRTPWKRKQLMSAKSNPDMTPTPTPRRSVAVSNPRHRRSRSTGNELWVDHQSVRPVPLNTVMQPQMKRKKSVTRLSEKDLADPKSEKYCLTTQEQDTDGELETKLYKGDIIPTAGGGRQVIFNDVEVLKQVSPEKSPDRVMTRRSSKRSFDEQLGSVGSRVAALEHRLGSAKKYRV